MAQKRSTSAAGPVPLPDHALVLRGGSMELSDLKKTAELCATRKGRPGISVNAADVEEVAALLKLKPVPHLVIRVSTMGRVRTAGFTVEQTGNWPHHTVWIPKGDLDEWLIKLEQAFDQPIPKPEL